MVTGAYDLESGAGYDGVFDVFSILVGLLRIVWTFSDLVSSPDL